MKRASRWIRSSGESIRYACVLLAGLALTASQPATAAAGDLLNGETWTLAAPADHAVLTQTSGIDLPRGANSEYRVQVTRPTDPFYLVELTAGLQPGAHVGDRLRFGFWARAGGSNEIRAVVETQGSPWTAVCNQMITLTPAWKHYVVDGQVDRDYGQPLAARLQVGESTGTIEFAGMSLTDSGPDPEIAAARAAVEPSAVRSRIRRYRMVDIEVRVVDTHDHPVPHARVTLRETRSAFHFGCNFFGLNPADNSAPERAYRDQFTALFNYATLPFYWGAFEPEKGKPQFARLDAMVDWCLAHGIDVKAHPLVWHEVYPAWAPADPESAIPLLNQRVTDIVGRERDRVRYFDVVNEAANGASYSPPNGESRWLKRDGAPVVVETALSWAAAARGDSPDMLIYNDYDTGDANLALLGRLEKDGTLPDAIGLQSHMHTGVWPMEQVWMVCDRFSRFHRPIHFTETTVLSGPQRPLDYAGPPATDWNSTPEGEAAQADYVVKFYSVLFSHPNVQAITWWDFSDQGAWLGAPSGLVRKDMTPKPAYTRLLQLIRHDWWTNVSGSTLTNGVYRTRAFYGDYEVDVDGGHGRRITRKASFRSGKSQVVTIVVR